MSPPGWQHLRRYQPEANHNRASPRHRSLRSPYVAEGHTALPAPLAHCHLCGERQRANIRHQVASGASSVPEVRDCGSTFPATIIPI
ncbi:MAG: hypothetical protein ACI4AN_03260 [Muribaculaceae bacterium]